ncbi:hemolysin family protein [Streptomyces profundus]|uniref:hemolysin family protein n=1 Tax=Streptomyces profundus TaxID=2867410 RepID=UPI001D16D404|nr:hemolysin family protein [Streptomyces sp. MA3_2.13]UED87289.1 hemolysin family protein [Streptomyces sp. MA3_2.13]
MTEVLLLFVALGLTLTCAVFVAAEFSLTTVERGQLERAAREGQPGAASAVRAVRELTFQLSGAQLGITVTSVVIGMLAEPSVSALLRGPLDATGLPSGASSTLALVLGVGLSTVVLMVVGELVPKNWAISRPVPVARAIATPHRLFTNVFGPFIRHLNGMANRLVRGFGIEPTEELASARSPQELVALARHSAAEGVLPRDSAELFVRTLHLAELTTQNVMTPRVDVRALPATATGSDAAELTRETGLSRFPVYERTLDEVVGMVHIKDVLALEGPARAETSVLDLLTEPVLVPDSLPVDRLLERLRGTRSLGVVVDEYGGTAGVVTLEDIVEEVVGEVRDEHDPQQTPDLAPIGPGHWEAGGSARVDQLAAIGLQVPEGPYETVAGLLATELARIPATGDTVEVAGWRLTVLRTARHRAERVGITAPPPEADAQGREGAR